MGSEMFAAIFIIVFALIALGIIHLAGTADGNIYNFKWWLK